MPRMHAHYLIVACVFLLAAVPIAKADTDTNVVTAQSIVGELGYRDIRASHLLAFSAQIDNRPLYAECALLVIEFTTNTWRIVHVYRHPKAAPVHWHRWTVSARIHVRHAGYRDFGHRPSEAEVDGFLPDTHWEFGTFGPSFRLIKGEVYADTWKRALGYTPKHAFPKPAA
jgi:hypothetical protein